VVDRREAIALLFGHTVARLAQQQLARTIRIANE